MKSLKKKTYTTLLDLPNMVLKGFMVPNGYTLNIQTKDGEVKTLNTGEYSGSTHSFQEVLEGSVEGWMLTANPTNPGTAFDTPVHLNSPQQIAVLDSAYQTYAKEGLGMEPLPYFQQLFKTGSNPTELLKPEIAGKIRSSVQSTIAGKLEESGVIAPATLDIIQEAVDAYNKHTEAPPTPYKDTKPKATSGLLSAKKPVPLEVRIASTPGQVMSQSEERVINLKAKTLLRDSNYWGVTQLAGLYTNIRNDSDMNVFTPKAASEVRKKMMKMDTSIPFEQRVGMALEEAFPDSMFQQASGKYADVEYSTDVMTEAEKKDIISSIPANIRPYISLGEGISIKGDIARYLGENIVDDFGLFVDEKEYTPNPPKITNPLDIRQIPKYKIKGKSIEESRYIHICDVATPETLNLFDDSLDTDTVDSLLHQFMNLSVDEGGSRNKSMSPTRYMHEVLMEYVASQPGCENPKQLIHDWSTGEWGASSSTGYALRFIEADISGRKKEDEIGYKEFVEGKPDFEKEIEDKMTRYRKTYIELKIASGRLFDGAFPEGMDSYRGFGAGGILPMKEFLDQNSIQMSSMSCFSASKDVAERFSIVKDMQGGDIEKNITIKAKVYGMNVAMLPSLAVQDDYGYLLSSGDLIRPKSSDHFNEYHNERELTLTSSEVFPWYNIDSIEEEEHSDVAVLTLTL
jgi:hypothetical protein